MRSMPSSTWAVTNRQPVPSGSAPQIDLLVTRDQHFRGGPHGVDDTRKWPVPVRLALLAGGVVSSWGGVWFVAHEIAKVIHGGT